MYCWERLLLTDSSRVFARFARLLTDVAPAKFPLLWSNGERLII